MRLNTWEKRRGTVLAWMRDRQADLQMLPEAVREPTETLLSSGLLVVHPSGAIVVGPWPVEAGTWSLRKQAEMDKFREVTAWVKALMVLVAPSPSLGKNTGAAGGVAGTVGVSAVAATGLFVAAGASARALAGVSSAIGVRGSGGGVAAATAGASGTPSIGTASNATAAAPAVMTPEEIATIVATAVSVKMTEFSDRLTSLEARGSASAGATSLSGGSAPVKAEIFAQALRDSLATTEDWDVDKEGGGRGALEGVRASAAGEGGRISEVREVGGKEEEAWAAGGGGASLPPLDAARRAQLAVLGGGFKTVNDEQLARALRGELLPEDIARPPSAAALPTAVASRGALAGVNLLVTPVQRLQQAEEGRLGWGKDGEFTVVPRTRKCKSMEEWARGFMRIICEAPAEEREDLADFLEWGKLIAAEYSFF
ncbi:hypothetical protein CYMTET_31349 [Cymbomonas tetramitiformis]|uniref:Uncharacterized protein n=1 Tax=Cymbomonas tetramitiformis TaxID=36881 RepID=A0AAE0FHP3_9CHLO|nr:hypothetical protein CYMTET_31349 [Cymbomonas tetramitiformis]